MDQARQCQREVWPLSGVGLGPDTHRKDGFQRPGLGSAGRSGTKGDGREWLMCQALVG